MIYIPENLLNNQASTEGLDTIGGLPNTSKVEGLATVSNKVDQTTQNIFSPDEFSGDVTKIMDAKGLDYDGAYNSVVDYYKQKGYTVKGHEDTFKVVETPVVPEEPEIQGLDVGVTAGKAISEFGKEFKFESNIDDGVIESGAKFLANLPGNTVQLAGDLISIFSNPVGTVQSINTLAKAGVESALNKAFSAEGEEVFTTQEIEQVADTVGKEMEKLGEPGRIKELLVENPTDVLLTVTGGLGVAKNVAKSKGLTSLANKLEKAENLTNPIKIQAEALKGIGKGISKGTERVSEKLIDTTLKFTPTQTKKVRAAAGDQSPSQWLINKGVINETTGIKGSEGIISKLQEFNSSAYNKLNEAVGNAKGVFKNDSIDKALTALRQDLSDVPGLETKFARIQELSTKAKRGEGLTLKETLEVKRAIDSNLDLYKITGDPRSGATKEGLINIRRDVREFIENEATNQGLGDIKALSNDVRVSRLIKDNLADRLDTASGNRVLSLTDVFVGGGAALGTDAGTALAILAGKKIIESPAFKIYAVKTLNLPKNIMTKLESGAK